MIRPSTGVYESRILSSIHYYELLTVCSIYALVIIVQVELQGAWFLEVAQHQLFIQ